MTRTELVRRAGATPEPSAPLCPPPTTCEVTDLRSGLTVRVAEEAGRASAGVFGEVDLACAHVLEHVLVDTLRIAPDGLDVDLSGVEFLDCAGLNVLLRLRARAMSSETRLALTAVSSAAARVLRLTGTDTLFPVEAAPQDGPGARASAP